MFTEICLFMKVVLRLCRFCKLSFIFLFAIVISGNLMAKDALLLKFDTRQLSPGKIELKLEFDSPPSVPTAFVLKNPDRILIDMWGVENGTSNSNYSLGLKSLRSVDLVQVKGRLRLVANLNRLTNYSSYAEGKNLFIILDQNQQLSQAPIAVGSDIQVLSNQGMASITNAPVEKRTKVQGIDFERAENGIGRIKIKLSDSRSGTQVSEEGHNVVVNLTGAVLSAGLNKRLDVQDFDTPVMFIDTFSQGQNTGILIKPSAKPYKFKSYQVGEELIVDFWPARKNRHSAKSSGVRNKSPSIQKQFTGEKIDLNFQNVKIRSVLQIISEVAQKNLVVDDSVSGSITLRLKNVPWDQALDLVLKTRGLDKRLVGNVLLIAPAAKLAERERLELEGQKQIEELLPIETEFIQINYRKSSEMKARLEEASLVSKRGFVLADDATNVLMVRETEKQLAVIRHTLAKFDVAVSQIMIEAKLVVATSDVTKDLGVRWGLGYGATGKYSVNGAGAGTLGAAPLAVDLGVSAKSAIRLGYIGSNGFKLSAEISALSTTGDAEVVSQPKIITTNGQPAEIQSGQQLPYIVVEDGASTVQFKDVVLSLKVTPQIAPGDLIALELELTQDSIGKTLPNGEVSINKNSLKTSVIVKDGDTIVLGGVYRNEKVNKYAKTPVLGDLPLVGALFRQSRKAETKAELLIFITPKLIRKSLSRN
ncbi:MAG: type 4 fimbrial biogenesis protein PilQ [Osedax symbiont Rs1]|nr:MAG: type 4 fimbrial biogenesis protein PilQ [Osedax symbiont Rs1]